MKGDDWRSGACIAWHLMRLMLWLLIVLTQMAGSLSPYRYNQSRDIALRLLANMNTTNQPGIIETRTVTVDTEDRSTRQPGALLGNVTVVNNRISVLEVGAFQGAEIQGDPDILVPKEGSSVLVPAAPLSVLEPITEVPSTQEAEARASASPTTRLTARLTFPEVGPNGEPLIKLGTRNDLRPIPDELATLRRIPGPIPWIAYTLALVEFCERFCYYGTTAVCELVSRSSQTLLNFFQLSTSSSGPSLKGPRLVLNARVNPGRLAWGRVFLPVLPSCTFFLLIIIQIADGNKPCPVVIRDAIARCIHCREVLGTIQDHPNRIRDCLYGPFLSYHLSDTTCHHGSE
jgi:hypothetical protein